MDHEVDKYEVLQDMLTRFNTNIFMNWISMG